MAIIKYSKEQIDLIYPIGSLIDVEDNQDPNVEYKGTKWIKVKESDKEKWKRFR